MLSENAVTVLEKRYLRKDDQGRPAETPEQLFRRVAEALAAPDALYGATPEQVSATAEAFFNLTYNLDFLPNSPTLANAGTDVGNLSACFVLPVDDCLSNAGKMAVPGFGSGIFDTITAAALIHQSGGGTGFAFSRLRPKNDLVNSTKGVSSGPVSFMDAFNAATESIKQGGMRRGANMGILRIDHPDIMAFIEHKEDLSKLTNFNISVAVTDAFMAAVKAGTDYALVNPRDGQEWGRLDARQVFQDIVQRAWRTGEPGLVFIDRMNEYCPVPWMGQYEATNPCGEQPLIPYESCNLGSINLENFVTTQWADAADMAAGKPGTATINWERLRQVVHLAVHLLDNVIDANTYPIPEIERVTKATRKIGLGVMGFARMLYKLGLAYGSPESLDLAEEVMSFLDFESKVASVELAAQRGPFPGRNGHEADSNAFYERLLTERYAEPGRHPHANFVDLIPLIEEHGIRNSTTTTVAPTGTLSIIADTSGGCEPVFALAFKRKQADVEMVDADKVFLGYLDTVLPNEPATRAEILRQVEANHGSVVGVHAVPESARQVFRTAHDISPEEHVLLQAAFQRYNDSATSKTINFPETAMPADVEKAYLLAYQTGCKGITVYRDNSRQFQPLSATQTARAPVEMTVPSADEAIKRQRAPRVRPEDLYGFTRTTQTGDGKLYTVVNYDAEGIREVVTNVGRSGGTLYGLSEAIGRLISLALQFHVPVDEIARSLIGIRSANPFGFGPHQVLSIPDAIGKVLKSAPRQLGQVLEAQPVERSAIALAAVRTGADAVLVFGESPECPECGGTLEHGEGCQTCRACGYSKCS